MEKNHIQPKKKQSDKLLHSPIALSRTNPPFPACHAHEHKSHVVSPSGVADSSRNSGRGGGGTNVPPHRPPSLASNGSGERASSSDAPAHQSTAPPPPLWFVVVGMTTDTWNRIYQQCNTF